MIRKAIIVILTLSCIAVLIDALTVYQADSVSGRKFHALELGENRSLWFRAKLNQTAVMYLAAGDPRKPDVLHDGPMGFGLKRHKFFDEPSKTYANTMYAAFCPTWFLIVVLGSYPFISFLRGPVRRFFRRRHGLCVKCGYNLVGKHHRHLPRMRNNMTLSGFKQSV